MTVCRGSETKALNLLHKLVEINRTLANASVGEMAKSAKPPPPSPPTPPNSSPPVTRKSAISALPPSKLAM